MVVKMRSHPSIAGQGLSSYPGTAWPWTHDVRDMLDKSIALGNSPGRTQPIERNLSSGPISLETSKYICGCVFVNASLTPPPRRCCTFLETKKMGEQKLQEHSGPFSRLFLDPSASCCWGV